MNTTPNGTLPTLLPTSVATSAIQPSTNIGLAFPTTIQQADHQVVTMNKLPTEGATPMVGVTTPQTMIGIPQPAMIRPSSGVVQGASSQGETKVLDKRRLQELVKEVDPLEQLDDDVEEVLLQVADDFIDSVVTAACQIAKHRKSNALEVKDVQLHLERNWNMWIPGFGSDELRPYKKAAPTEAHKQRMALIRKTLKKF